MARSEMTPERVIKTGKQFGEKITKKEARLISALLRGSEPAKTDMATIRQGTHPGFDELVSKVFNNPDNPLNKKVRTYVAKRDNIQPPFEVTGFTKKDVREALSQDTQAKRMANLSATGRAFKTKRMKARM
jgi:hypothetical protein